MNVLLVDDDDAARLTLQALLEDEGFDVIDASSSGDALERMRERGFDLVLLDQHIGDTLGTELIPEIRLAAPGARVVIVSGSTEDAVVGGDAFFPKGGAFPDLLALVRQLSAVSGGGRIAGNDRPE